MDPAQETEPPTLLDLLLLPAEDLMAEVAQLPPGGQCAVLGHPYPQMWQIAVDAAGGDESAYYHRTCPRCGSVEVTGGWSWPC